MGTIKKIKKSLRPVVNNPCRITTLWLINSKCSWKMVAASIIIDIGNWVRQPFCNHFHPEESMWLWRRMLYIPRQILSHYWPSCLIQKDAFFTHKLSTPELFNWAPLRTSHNMKCLLDVLTNRVLWPSKFKKHHIMHPLSWRVIRHINKQALNTNSAV